MKRFSVNNTIIFWRRDVKVREIFRDCFQISLLILSESKRII